MFRAFGKVVAEKLVGVIALVLAVVMLYLVWQNRQHLPTVGMFVARCVLWLVFATLLPWITFFMVALVHRAESNGPAAALLIVWALLDALLAWWLIMNGSIEPMGLVVVALAFCLGGLYNLIAANQIAARLQRR
ncbi:MAG: hypothetical protein BIFFINMI_03189 [Phycisphaerae bacterium]|nr:hypothetical protein [Phycisphaerae bacterium]